MALQSTKQEAERLRLEQQAAVGQGCCDPSKALLSWRDDDDNGGATDDYEGAAGQGGHAYEVVVRYRF